MKWFDRAERITQSIRWVGDTIAALWPWGKPRTYRCTQVDDFPDHLAQRTVYLAGEEGHIWAAVMTCPCGCGERIELNLLAQVRPSWTAERHEDGSVTLAPSVWRQKGCKSHFFVRRGRIIWCDDVRPAVGARR